MTLLVVSKGTRQWLPQQLTDVALASIGGFASYAAAVSLVLRSALHSLVRATDTAQGQQGALSGGGAGAAPGTPPVSLP